MSSPRWWTPHIAMVQGRRTGEAESPTTIWIDPFSQDETRDFLVVLQAMRGGAFDVGGFLGAAHRDSLRVSGLDQPPRQGCVTPAPSTPDSVAEPTSRFLARPRSPAVGGAWCPAKAFATLTLATFAARAQAADSIGHHKKACQWTQGEVLGSQVFGLRPNYSRAGHPGPVGPWPCWRLALGLDRMSFDATLGYPGEGPQLPHSTPTPKSETLSLITANVTFWSTDTDAGVLYSEAEVLIFQEVRPRGDSLRAARSEAKRAKYLGTWAAAKRIGPCGPASGGLATLVCETRAFRAIAPERPGPHWREIRWTHIAIGAGGTRCT